MICTVCKNDKDPVAFRLKKKYGALRRATQCRDCERERFNAARKIRRQRDRAHRSAGHAEGELWFVPRQPWPWPPGTAVFEDVRLREAR